MTHRPIEVAQHEAAHVVVGVALGLRMYEAVIKFVPGDRQGHVWFPYGPRLALALMYAAGVAWDRKTEGSLSRHDAKCTRRELKSAGRGAYENAVAAAGAMLAGLGPAHRRVTRALLERDLTGKDISKLARGERLDSE